ncbi:MAG: response regulator [Bacteroidetes bacterium]|nr:response regulator [Bacteroidota bacterium]
MTKANKTTKSNKLTSNKLEGKNILITDDNPINLIVLEKLLVKHGVNVFQANSGQEAIDKSNNQVYDFILMDLHMPEQDGIETSRLIRKSDNANKNTPIFAVTADITANKSIISKSIFDGFIYKPIEMDVLINTLIENKN